VVFFIFSNQIRCITCLTLPEFTSVSGKRFIQACIMILLLSGPVENIGANGEEVIRLVICFKDLTLNITLAGKDLLLAPIQHIIFDLKVETPFDFFMMGKRLCRNVKPNHGSLQF